MSKPYYRKATTKDALEVSKNLREEDRREIEGLGHSPLFLPIYTAMSDNVVAFFDGDGTIAGIGGIQPDERPGVGIVWMVCTPVVANKPHTLVRQARKWLEENTAKYHLLWNLADARNHLHHKLLKLLGFKALRTLNVGPYFLPYMEIVKLCAYQ